MHPDIAQLLEVRDSQAPATTAEHVASCAACQIELQRLTQLRDAMRDLPEVPVPDRVWQGMAARRRRPTHWFRIPALALAASVVMAVALTVTRPAQGPEPAVLPQNALADLAAQSDDLERLLASLDPESRAVDLETAGTIVALEDRIAAVDGHLRLATLDSSSAETLWQQRIGLMQALVGVHMASNHQTF